MEKKEKMITETGTKVQQFYNKTPFLDYELDRFNDKDDLINAEKSFAGILDRSISANATVIDIGTGTGQMAAVLSLRRKCVFGIDFSESSLKKARKLKSKLNLDSLTLKHIDILDQEQIKDIGLKFDYITCLGVLHHTGNAKQAFKNILKLLKPGGYIAVGLYNKYGRIPLNVRKLLAKTIFKNNDKVKDSFIRMQIGDVEDKEMARGWWNDQYLHPHETTHTIGEVLKWFNENEIEYYQTIPTTTPFSTENLEISGVWNKYNEQIPYLPIRIYKQLIWIWKTHHEGGYWVTFGRKHIKLDT